MATTSKQGSPLLPRIFLHCTLFVIAVLYLPRLVSKGMFGDGLLYASMSRNMAESRGSLWSPFFSSGYWLDYVQESTYYENLPLGIWLESLFFRAIGDYWWTEKVYCSFILAINIFLIYTLWQLVFSDKALGKKTAWLPLLLWYIMPPVIWGNPNNLLDNTQLVFCLLAIIFAIKSLKSEGSIVDLLLSAACIFLGILAKGPVALYPVAAPFFYGLIVDSKVRKRSFGISVSLFLLSISMFFALLYVNADALIFVKKYVDQRLMAVIWGSRADAELMGWNRLNIVYLLIKEQLPVLLLAGLVLWVYFKKTILFEGWTQKGKLGVFFLALGLASTLPIAVSARQNAIYLLPGLPMFALGFGFLFLPLVDYWMSKINHNALFREKKKWATALAVSWLGLFVFLGINLGKPGREDALQKDLLAIKTKIPSGEKVAVCSELLHDFGAHTYFQRYHRLELCQTLEGRRFAFVSRKNDKNELQRIENQGFKKQWEGDYLLIFEKK